MREVIIIILLLCILNTFLLVKHMSHMRTCKQENYADSGVGYTTPTYTGPYQGVAICSGVGNRVVTSGNAEATDALIFNGLSPKKQ
jgi:hypothetical protein